MHLASGRGLLNLISFDTPSCRSSRYQKSYERAVPCITFSLGTIYSREGERSAEKVPGAVIVHFGLACVRIAKVVNSLSVYSYKVEVELLGLHWYQNKIYCRGLYFAVVCHRVYFICRT